MDIHVFQSAFHRGNGCYITCGPAGSSTLEGDSFSPLFIAAMVATISFEIDFQAAAMCTGSTLTHNAESFSPLFIAAMVATLEVNG